MADAECGTAAPLGCGQETRARLTDCIETAYTIELPLEAYALPANFSNNPGVGQQLLSVVFAQCDLLIVGVNSWQDVSIGYTGIRVQAAGDGPDADIAVFDLEAITDSEILRGMLVLTGVPVVQGSISLADDGGRRSGTVIGDDVDYTFSAFVAPIEGQRFTFSEAHYSESGHYLTNSDCTYYEATAPIFTLASEGRLTEAGAAAMAGQGGQPTSCDITLDFR